MQMQSYRDAPKQSIYRQPTNSIVDRSLVMHTPLLKDDVSEEYGNNTENELLTTIRDDHQVLRIPNLMSIVAERDYITYPDLHVNHQLKDKKSKLDYKEEHGDVTKVEALECISPQELASIYYEIKCKMCTIIIDVKTEPYVRFPCRHFSHISCCTQSVGNISTQCLSCNPYTPMTYPFTDLTKKYGNAINKRIEVAIRCKQKVMNVLKKKAGIKALINSEQELISVLINWIIDRKIRLRTLSEYNVNIYDLYVCLRINNWNKFYQLGFKFNDLEVDNGISYPCYVACYLFKTELKSLLEIDPQFKLSYLRCVGLSTLEILRCNMDLFTDKGMDKKLFMDIAIQTKIKLRFFVTILGMTRRHFIILNFNDADIKLLNWSAFEMYVSFDLTFSELSSLRIEDELQEQLKEIDSLKATFTL